MLIGRLRKLRKYDPERERELRDGIEAAGGLEKNDLKAMILSALIVILPVALGILLLFALVAWLFLF